MSEVTCLPSGLRVASCVLPGMRTAAVVLAAGAGSRHEPDDGHGLAHLFEHMVFKGTATRSARAIAEAIEDAGGTLNAWTAREMTLFHARVLAQDVALAVDLLADLVQHPRFDPADLEVERQVILSEIGEARDVPEDLAFDLVHEVAFAGAPMGRSILGTPESLARLSPAALEAWRQERYRAQGLVLAAAGAVDHGQLVELAGRAFADVPAGAPPPAAPARWAGGVAGERRRSAQTQVVLAWPGPGLHDPHHYAAQLFATALGGGMSSPLFQELRERRGLAYSVGAFHQPHDELGVMTVSLATAPKDARSATALAHELAWRLADTLDETELARARSQLQAGLLMGLETCAGQAEWLARTLLAFGRAVPPAEAAAAIDRVTVEEARAAGRAILSGSSAVASVGPRLLTGLS
ncbi:MAG: insulinase family protein [Sphingomonadaceae bacterium]|nr:insulinase family protein [Sphingomonadaceae bacterium]